MKRIAPLIVLLLSLTACDPSELFPDADEKFGEQNFKSAVALMELHKTRTGEYPKALAEIDYLGDWDQIWLSAVKYVPVEGGYNLYVERGWVAEPKLTFPKSYRIGLGLQESNVTWVSKE